MRHFVLAPCHIEIYLLLHLKYRYVSPPVSPSYTESLRSEFKTLRNSNITLVWVSYLL